MVTPPPPEPNAQPTSRYRLDRDEAIAIAVALLSFGIILWWGWSRGQRMFSPAVERLQRFGTADPSSVEDTQRPTDELRSSDLERSAEQRDRRANPLLQERERNGTDATRTNSANLNAVDRERRSVTQSSDTIAAESASIASLTARSATAIAPSASATADDSIATSSEDAAALNDSANPTAGDADSSAENATATSSPATPLPALNISDVPKDHWARDYIVSLFTAGMLPDLPGGQLQPEQILTRAELAALLSRSLLDDAEADQLPAFSDVPDDFWAADAIRKVTKAGYMVGVPGGKFLPEEPVLRYQVLVTLTSGLGIALPDDANATLNQFQDSQQLPEWAKLQTAAAIDAGVAVNYPNPQQLEPLRSATRAEIIAMMHQALVAQGRIEPVAESPYVIPAQ